MTEKISWNTHCILTRRALQSCADPVLDSEVPVVEIEHFLQIAGEGLPHLLGALYDAVGQDTRGKGNQECAKARIETVDDLAHALRINPNTTFSYVRALRPDEVPADAGHDPSRKGPPAASYMQTRSMERIAVREILATFSDEPDWGMDQDLFPIKSYQYGAPPFGPATGPSSQASFHMAFSHENTVSLRIWPGLGSSFMEQRIRAFVALAKLALDKGVDYWGWRFAAWAAHYLQDLTQPYHAKALPFPIPRILRLLISSPYLALERRSNYLANRHVLFESAAHFLLNNAVKSESDHPFFKALGGSGECARGSLERLMKESSRIPAKRALEANRLLERIIDDPRINRPDYFVSEDTAYPVAAKLATASFERPEVVERFLSILAGCFSETGTVTRYVVNAIGAAGVLHNPLKTAE